MNYNMGNDTSTDTHESIATRELQSPEFHFERIGRLVYPAECDGSVPLASHPDNRYPYAYPRDIASITRAWLTAIDAGIESEQALEYLTETARFFLDIQDDTGRWRQRYTLAGIDESIYRQEDNIAHGIRVLAHTLLGHASSDGLGQLSTDFLERTVTALVDAISISNTALYDPNAHLVESTTSIHEGRIESGYTLWVNCAFIAALRLTAKVVDSLSVHIDTAELERTIEAFLPPLERGVERAFTNVGLVPRRYTPDGEIDYRPDVTLFAPYYFDLDDLFEDATDTAATRAASALEDPELGGLQRFLGFHGDFDVQQHGGNGPWMQYTAWHAQYQFDRGTREKGDVILETIASYVDQDGHIPEHLTTRQRFESFIEDEWHTRKDFEKEFDEAVLRDVSFDRIVEELGHMKAEYDRMAERTETQEVVGFARPLTWSHAEFLVALLRRTNSL
jgi:GH15 family glucan-1,4-alpha-glucosidase